VGIVAALKCLASPKRALAGNWIGSCAMALAIAVTLSQPGLGNLLWIAAALAVGAIAGTVMAQRVPMTRMPQFVAIFNGFGGLASALVSLGECLAGAPSTPTQAIVTAFGALVGGVTFSGSVIAYGKLEGVVSSAPVTFSLQKAVNAVALAAAVGLCIAFGWNRASDLLVLGVLALSLLLGLFAVLPIGGADMPVVIALLNSYSGLAGAAVGYAIGSDVLIVAGALVGASGVILTVLMCRAMNRSLANVLFGAFGTGDSHAGTSAPQRAVRRYDMDDAALLLASAHSVVIAPGYGLAVAQAQHACRELADELQRRGSTVAYAIHPVAGRMPGHMNVLLAEANVPYEQLKELAEINPYFETTDVVLVLGANDVINPVARTDATSPIFGMPILDVDRARQVIVVKRSLASGFAGIDNPLFYADKTMMLFGDAKEVLTRLLAAVKATD
jgi:NAD(P) transhydrogenase subunit beta